MKLRMLGVYFSQGLSCMLIVTCLKKKCERVDFVAPSRRHEAVLGHDLSRHRSSRTRKGPLTQEL